MIFVGLHLLRGLLMVFKYANISNWCLTAPIKDNQYDSTIHESEDLLVGTFTVVVDDVPNKA
jgi:hypothetical protein